jgi:rod shape-determining protein MreB
MIIFNQPFSWLFPCKRAYLRICAHELYLRDLDSGREWRGPPVVAATKPATHKTGPFRKVVAVGNAAAEAVSRDPENLEIMECFNHPRSIIDDFYPAQALLLEVFRSFYKGSFTRLEVVMHPLEKLEHGLTKIEVRALMELGEASGAFRSCVWVGPELTDKELRSIGQKKYGLLSPEDLQS